MGRVWLARDELLDRDAAVTEMPFRVGLTEAEMANLRRRMLREAPAARVAVWDLGNLARFLEAVRDDPLFVLWWLVALRGPRRGETAGLSWADIDLAAGELTIREQIIVIGGREHIRPPKSAAGMRTLALDEATVQLIRELWHEQRRRHGEGDQRAGCLSTRIGGQ